MFEGDSADTCGGKFLRVTMGGRAEGLTCADPGATPIGASGNDQLVVRVGLSNNDQNCLLFKGPPKRIFSPLNSLGIGYASLRYCQNMLNIF